jgi:hypothetical protein
MSPRSSLLLLQVYALAAAGGCYHASGDLTPGPSGGLDTDKADTPVQCTNYRPLKNAYFGDLHAHTAYSLDAYSFATRNTPIDAYAFARGKTLQVAAGSPNGGPTTTIERPLDFLAVTDHSEWLSVAFGCGQALDGTPYDPQSPYYASADCYQVRSNQVLPVSTRNALCSDGGCGAVQQSAWQAEQAAAASAYVPCQFTSFVAYEWTHTESGATLHKNVIFASDKVPAAPLDSITYPSQAELWSGLDQQCTADKGCEAITIPHNSNLSKGGAFNIPDGLEAQSAKYQKLIEVFQHKGNSECFYDNSPDAGPQDPECNFEYGGGISEPNLRQSYIRYALHAGLSRAASTANPFMFGFIGSTDDHNGTPGNTREDTWPGHAGRLDDAPHKRIKAPVGGGPDKRVSHNPGGLAVAWAEQNTRDSIFAAFKRRETYATSGTRILVRFYQTWADDDVCADASFPAQVVQGGGVPMGGTFGAASGGATLSPRFVVYAWKDKVDLARIDIVKLWYDAAGAAHESIVHDAIPDGMGNARCFTWQDTAFTPGPTVYYARVLEKPSPRWSVGDCAAAPGVAPADCAPGGALNQNIQERAWTSPIWYTQ